MRALVTGAGGFVGRHLVRHLASCGDEVTETDRATGGPDVTDMGAMDALVAGSAPEVVFHLAGQADVARSWRDPVGTLRANAEGTLAVLAACHRAGVQRVVVVTSAEVYGKVETSAMPIGEDRPLDPVSPYAASKAAAEMLCVAWANQGLGVVRARAFNHLGPGQSEAFVAPAIAARLVRARRDGVGHISVGNLEARRDFTDVRDVVRAYRMLAVGGISGEAYNVCSGRHHSIAEVVEELLELTGHEVELVADPALARPSDVPLLVGDPGKIRRQCGWGPEIDLSTTLADVVAAIVEAESR